MEGSIHIDRMRSRATALEQLLEVFEATVLEKSGRLERTLAELERTNQALRREISERQRAKTALQRAHLELEKRVRQRTEELSRANRDLELFANAASHDLQEPLRKIEAFGAKVQRDYGEVLGEEGRDLLARMVNAAERMRCLTTDLLKLAKLGTGQDRCERVDLVQTVQDVLCDLEVSITESRARVSVGELPTVEADAAHMRLLFQNLIGNSLKFRREEECPLVHVCLESHGGVGNGDQAAFWRIVVQDNGIGFEERYAERIFEPLVRLHGRRAYPGTGIGLALCRKIVERYGGSIVAHSVPGRGTAVVVALPVRRSHANGAGQDHPPQELSP